MATFKKITPEEWKELLQLFKSKGIGPDVTPSVFYKENTAKYGKFTFSTFQTGWFKAKGDAQVSMSKGT